MAMAAEDLYCVLTWNKEFYPVISDPHIRLIFDIIPGGGITRVLIRRRRALVLYRNPVAAHLSITMMLADPHMMFERLFQVGKVLCSMPIRAPPYCDYCDIEGHHNHACIQRRQPVHYLLVREVQGRWRLGSMRKSCALLNLKL